jgi:putative pre-16S rRNA nuclease
MNDSERKSEPGAPVLALDLGQKTVGVAICDEMSITITRLSPLKRSSWKSLVQDVKTLVERFDARTLVIGLPLNLDGSKGNAAENAERLAFNFARSLPVAVYLQDERLTSNEAASELRMAGYKDKDVPALIDSESAAIILRDFLNGTEEKLPVRANSPDQELRSE